MNYLICIWVLCSVYQFKISPSIYINFPGYAQSNLLHDFLAFHYDKLDEHSTHVRVSIILIVFKFACYINLRIGSFEVSAKDQYLSVMINSVTFFAMIFINSLLFNHFFFLETNNLVINY